jgi:hypothetical protein
MTDVNVDLGRLLAVASETVSIEDLLRTSLRGLAHRNPVDRAEIDRLLPPTRKQAIPISGVVLSSPRLLVAVGSLPERVLGPPLSGKTVAVTAKAKRILDCLAAEWRATEAVIADIESEIPYPLSQVVTDIEAVLHVKSFYDRITEKLAADPPWR